MYLHETLKRKFINLFCNSLREIWRQERKMWDKLNDEKKKIKKENAKKYCKDLLKEKYSLNPI